MTVNILPGGKGEPLPNGIIVVRLAKPSMDGLDLNRAHPSHFSLSTADEEAELKSLSVWARDITSPEVARDLMGESRTAYSLALNIRVEEVRAIRITDDFPNPPLNVVWDPDPRPGAGGHAGITGLMRPPGGERKMYKALRAKLADIAVVEVLTDFAA